ncbi:hypothetical protein [Bradyrhizobium cenepequi]
MRTPGASVRYRLSGASASNPAASTGSAVSLPSTPNPRSLVLAQRIRDAEFRVERGRQIVARQRELAVNCAGTAGVSATTLLETYEKVLEQFEVHLDNLISRHPAPPDKAEATVAVSDPIQPITPTVEGTAVEVSPAVTALQQRATGLFAYRLERRCQAVVQSEAFFKTMVIGGGLLPIILTMLALSAG